MQLCPDQLRKPIEGRLGITPIGRTIDVNDSNAVRKVGASLEVVQNRSRKVAPHIHVEKSRRPGIQAERIEPESGRVLDLGAGGAEIVQPVRDAIECVNVNRRGLTRLQAIKRDARPVVISYSIGSSPTACCSSPTQHVGHRPAQSLSSRAHARCAPRGCWRQPARRESRTSHAAAGANWRATA
jgi:hypothetical protein